MNKITSISFPESFKILCFFSNGEQRLLNLEKALNSEEKYAKKILDKKIFNQAKVGSFGEIYWDGIAEMKGFDGSAIPCEYDICPDFAYLNSEPVIETAHNNLHD